MNVKATATALKNKVTGKVGKTLATPYVKYKESQTRTADKNYSFLKDYNAKSRKGLTSQKEDAQFQMLNK